MAGDPEIPESDRLGDLPHPRSRAELFGHGDAEARFVDAFRGGHLAHAWVLAGPRGIGKATLAYRMARFMLRQPHAAAGQGLDMAPGDPVFQRVASLGHPDLLVLRRPWDPERKRPKAVIPVEEVRRAGGFFAKSAGEGGWRVCVVDSVDDLNANGFNALLKAVEEPPDKSLFVIVCHAPGNLPATIRSRCRVMNLRPPADDVADRLVAEHFPDLPHGDRRALVRLASGSPGQALSLAMAGGLDLYRAMVGLIAELPRLDVPALHGFADTAVRRGDDGFRVTMELLAGWLARLVRETAAETPGQDDFAPGETEAMRRLAGRGSLDRWIELWEKVNRALAEAEALNPDRKQVVLNAFSGLQTAAQS
jgi:DNA polymerase-3 subunit delta'